MFYELHRLNPVKCLNKKLVLNHLDYFKVFDLIIDIILIIRLKIMYNPSILNCMDKN